MVDEHGHPSLDEMDFGKIMAALADPMRRRVIGELLLEPSGTERNCASFNLPVTKSTCTHHFRVLRESGLVRDVDYGNRKGVTLRSDELELRFPGLLALVSHEALAEPVGQRP
jgi:DNA-binding transcriptional ArsR family regulator